MRALHGVAEFKIPVQLMNPEQRRGAPSGSVLKWARCVDIRLPKKNWFSCKGQTKGEGMSSQGCNPSWMPEFTQEEIAACAAQPGALLTMELELTRACNLVCKYCYASSGQPLNSELDYAELADVVAQAKDLGARRIIVLGGGEPLLYPQLRGLIAHMRNLGLKVDIFTNGTLLTREWADFFFLNHVSVNVKFNSAKPEVQDYLAGRRGTHTAIAQALDCLHQAGYPDEDHRLGIETVICRQNIEELPDIWRWARHHQYIPYIEMLTPQGRLQEHMQLEVTSQEAYQVFEKIRVLDEKEFGHRWVSMPPLIGENCRRHTYSCLVDSLGNVSPCPGVDVRAGNIRERSLKEILVSTQVFQDLRNVRERIEGECRVCEHTSVCYGCRGAAYQRTSNYLASDPLCWHVQALRAASPKQIS
jgi:radical SAM protein with 4Fe4S-binding SPASM domain